MQLALNLCDIGAQEHLEHNNPHDALAYLCMRAEASAQRTAFFSAAEPPYVSRLYVGSYFCEWHFLSLTPAFWDAVSTFTKDNDLGLTLVVPIFGQHTLKAGFTRARSLIKQGFITELVVNDYGAAEEFAPLCRKAGVALCWGRLLNKQLRDVRYSRFTQHPQPVAIDIAQAETLRTTWGVTMPETDPAAPVVDLSPLADAMPMALHLPHCYNTTGHICEAQSATTAQPFRAGATCSRECTRHIDLYPTPTEPGTQAWLIKQGRTVYFENPTCACAGGQPARIIWAPDDLLCPIEGGAPWA